jgi:hypothetical protein
LQAAQLALVRDDRGDQHVAIGFPHATDLAGRLGQEGDAGTAARQI